MSLTQLIAYSDAVYPAVWINTFEETRFCEDVHTAFKARNNDTIIYEWECLTGLYLKTTDALGNEIKPLIRDTTDIFKLFAEVQKIINTRTKVIFILKDFHFQFEKSLKRAELITNIKNLLPMLSNTVSMLVFVSPNAGRLPVELVKDVVSLDYSLPDEECIGALFEHVIKSAENALTTTKGDTSVCKVSSEIRKAAIIAAKGLTSNEILNLYGLAFIKVRKFDQAFVDCVFAEKIAQLKRTIGLTYLPSNISFDNVGGLVELKKWIRIRKTGFTDKARTRKLPYPKGVGLSGFPGVGKTLSAKAIAHEFGYPLFQLNIGALFDKFVGSTEQNFIQVIQVIEALGHCVLLIDEIEKYLSESAVSGRSDSGTSSRSFGTLLSWLSDRTNPAFIVYTTNDHTILPDALIRKGRFDELFWLDLPDKADRKEIIDVILKKYNINPAQLDITKFVEITKDFTGAEIENLFVDALFAATAAETELTMEHIVTEHTSFKPQAVIKPEKIHYLRSSIKGELRLASLKLDSVASTKIKIPTLS